MAQIQRFIPLLVCAQLCFIASRGYAQSESVPRIQSRVADNRRGHPVVNPKPPFVLNAVEQQQVDKILFAWEQRSEGIETFSCKFNRWEYDRNFGPKDEARTISTGAIHYKAPDKGEFHVQVIKYHTVPRDNNGNPILGAKVDYVERPGEPTERWVCDGDTICEFDPRQKKLYERKLPLEMRGKAIADGPLPFLFGAKAAKLKRLYWIRESPFQDQTRFRLEFRPKNVAGARNFERVFVILSAKQFLPEGLVLTHPGGNSWTTFQFVNTKVNARKPGAIIDFFTGGNRFRPTTPKGWQRVTENFTQLGEPAQAQRPAQGRSRTQ